MKCGTIIKNRVSGEILVKALVGGWFETSTGRLHRRRLSDPSRWNPFFTVLEEPSEELVFAGKLFQEPGLRFVVVGFGITRNLCKILYFDEELTIREETTNRKVRLLSDYSVVSVLRPKFFEALWE